MCRKYAKIKASRLWTDRSFFKKHFRRMRTTAIKRSPEIEALGPTEVYDAFWRFAAERQAIFERRRKNLAPPWTDDPVLLANKFTNVYRASDRISQYLIRNVIYTGGSFGSEDTVFRILLFKIFNKIETWKLLEREFGEISISNFSPEHFGTVLSAAMERGESIYSGAYIMPSGLRSLRLARKHQTHLTILQMMIESEVPKKVADSRSLGELYSILRSQPLLGDFLAYQYAIDINYSEVTGFSESDFVMPGPGARSGIRKCFANAGGYTESEIIGLVTDRQRIEFQDRGLDFSFIGGRPLQQIDIQNVFCEIDKYARVCFPEISGKQNRTRIKHRFHANPTPIDYLYPPKWKLS